MAEFKALQHTHRLFHQAAYMALCLCKVGKPDEAEDSIESGEFHRLSEEMIVRLRAMQIVVAAKKQALVCEPVGALTP